MSEIYSGLKKVAQTVSVSSQNQRIIFGLKVKELRKAKELSFKELSAKSGLSVSYLNEIEKGKKFPRKEKIEALSAALDISVASLTSPELHRGLSPLSELLKSNFLNELHLDLFGIDTSKVVEIIANAPARVAAFISALMEISRKYELQQEHFYFASLRSYQELHDNYFEELENAADEFVKDNKLSSSKPVSIDKLYTLLQKKYRYKIDLRSLHSYPALSSLQSVFVPNKKRLLINNQLTDEQKSYQLGKELGFNYLKLKERPHTSTFLRIRSFEQVLNDFKASYFSMAILLNRQNMVKDIRRFFSRPTWSPLAFIGFIERYKASPEIFINRLCTLIPRFFGIHQLFFLKFNHELDYQKYYITKELHLTRPHHPHGNEIEEHYCRRWVSIWLLDEFKKNQAEIKNNEPIIGIQRSKYIGTDDEYLCLTIAYSGGPIPNLNISLTIGLLVNDKLREVVKFIDDPNIPVRMVNQTCERCGAIDCKERIAPPTIVEQINRKNRMQDDLREIFNQ